MSFRERLKQVKDDAKAWFKRKGSDKGSSRPNTPSSPGLYPNTSALVGQLENQGESMPGVSPPDQATRTPPNVPQISITPYVEEHLEELSQARAGVAGLNPIASNVNIQEADVDRTISTGQVTPQLQVMERTAVFVPSDHAEPISQSMDQLALDAKPREISGNMTRTKGFQGLGTTVLDLATDSLKLGFFQGISDTLLKVADIYDMEEKVKEEYEALHQRLQIMLKSLESHLEEGSSPAVTSEIQGMRESIKRELSSLVNKDNKQKQGGKFRMARDEETRFLNCTRQIQNHMDQLLFKTSIKTSKLEEEQLKNRENIHKLSVDIAAKKRKEEEKEEQVRVDNLKVSALVLYNSIVGRRRECTPGTRAKVLDNLLGWASDTNISGVYWLNGMAGTGKTTIAYSLCKKLAEKRQLAASFFCSHLHTECQDVGKIFPSIAHQLAQFSPKFRSALSAILEEGVDAHSIGPGEQCEKLIREPLLAVHAAKPITPGEIVVVIDALDECENKASTKTMLLELLSNAADLPIKFIVSSRPEPQIRDQMTTERVKSRLVLHDLDTGEVKTDIEAYLRAELEPMNPPPSEAQIAALVKKAGGLFIYAATAVRYISYDDFHSDPMGRIHDILQRSQFQDSEENNIDKLYNMIVKAALDDRGLRPVDRLRRQQVLYAVICAREPLTVKDMSAFLEINEVEYVRNALRPFWSVIYVEDSKPVATLHASFPEFMFDSARCTTYHCNPSDQNSILAEHCFKYIAQIRSQFNICGLESSYLLDKTVPNIKERVETCIPTESLYACRYWADHVEAGKCALNVTKQLRDFLSTRLLLWVEVLNLNGKIQAGTECMKLAVDWCNQFEADEELVGLTHDAKRFVDAFASNPVSQSTPHIYVSMLAFWPKSTPISRHYSRFTRGPVRPEGTALDRRQLVHVATWTFEGPIKTLSIYPDGLFVALGIGEDVLIVDSSNGRVVKGPLKGHTDTVTSVAFSPDGARILSAGFKYRTTNATVIGWDVQTGDRILGPLQLVGHTARIYCLSFSPDCTCAATGSDNTIRVWDVNTGAQLHSLDTQGTVCNVAFSSSGALIAAELGGGIYRIWDRHAENTTVIDKPTDRTYIGAITFSSDNIQLIHSTDNALYLRNAQTGNISLGPIQGHTARVSCIRCSSDGRYIVSGSDDRTVRVWDAQNGNLVLGPLEAHTGTITSVAFTPDCSRIISACKGGLVCTWDARQRNLTPTSNQTPSSSDRITCVKFSSDGTRFVSGSKEGRISIWDAHTGEMIVGPIKPHSKKINRVNFLGDRVVSGSYDEMICVCDARTGEVVLGPLELGSGAIYSVAYSPDGKLIATGSYRRVDVWNAEDGSRVLGPLTGLKGELFSLQFSPDGTRIVAASWAYSSNLAIWDVSDGTKVFGTLDGHTNSVMSISYSPNGALVASGSWDKTIIIWDAYTGKKALDPLTGHSDRVRSVHFSPDSTRLVSGSNDRTIRIWDVQTGEMIFELLHGHEGIIISVAYSPDGTRILSLSDDGSVRIHDARSPEERAKSRSASDIGDWTMNKDGWVVDDQSRLLVWVPWDLQKALMWPSTLQVKVPPPNLRLQFDMSCIGESWQKVDKSRM